MSHRKAISRGLLIFMAAAVAVAAGCAPGADAEHTAESSKAGMIEPQQITITTKNYFFIAPDTIESGMTKIRLANSADELHHVQLVRLADGHTAAELEEAIKSTPQAPPPSWISFVGGPNTPVPGGESSATLKLEPGSYALICLIPSPKDGVPHMMKGMVRGIVVKPSDRFNAPEPVADVVVKLSDYDFTFEGALKPGALTIRVENTAQQPHELVLLQLEPGRKIEELADHKDGKPHAAHGMMKQFTIS